MAMSANEIEELILKTFPNAKITIDDLRGDGDHYAAQIITEEFKGKTRVQQHQMIYNAMEGHYGVATNVTVRRVHSASAQMYSCTTTRGSGYTARHVRSRSM